MYDVIYRKRYALCKKSLYLTIPLDYVQIIYVLLELNISSLLSYGVRDRNIRWNF